MKILIRADASSTIGTGHVMRCLALAQAWLENGRQASFLMVTQMSALEPRLLAEGITIDYIASVPGSQEDAAQTIAKAKALGASWVVVDGYHFDANYQRAIRMAGLKQLFLDDYGHASHHWANLVLNQNIYAQQQLYVNREANTQLLLGTAYVLLRKEFWRWRHWHRDIPTIARKVLVTLGGADPDNVTLKVIQALQIVNVDALEVVAIVGGNNPHYDQLQMAVQNLEVDISLQHNVTNMPELMAWADVAITAGGSTCWELCFMGLPSLMIILAKNQCAIAKTLNSLGVTISLGWHNSLSLHTLQQELSKLIYATDLRREIAAHARKLVDGEGSDRILMYLEERELRLRKVRKDDCQLIWQWANDPAVRSHSFSLQPIPWSEHVVWFQSKQQSPDCQFYIVLDRQERALGNIRFDISQNEAVVSVTIDRQFRGQGYGSKLIKLGSSKVLRNPKIFRLNAYVKPENEASIRAFIKAGFDELGSVIYNNMTAIQFTKQH